MSRTKNILLLFILLLATFLRFWQLGSLPLGLYHDEAYNGLDALALVEGQTFPIFHEGWELYAEEAHAEREPAWTRWPLFFEGNYGREPLHIYLMAIFQKLFGATPFAIRAVPAFAGVFAVATTYLATAVFAKKQDSKAPLFAALALASLYPAVHFSRFGLRPMLFVPVETLCVTFFWRAVSNRNLQSPISNLLFTFAGILLGAGIYIYAAGRLFPLLFLIFVCWWFLFRRETWQRHWRGIALMAAVSFLTALPLLIYFLRYPYFFFFRIAYVANRGAGVIAGQPALTRLYNAGRVFRGLFWHGETHFRHNLPGRPFMDAIQAGFFLVGGIGRIRLFKQPRVLFLWLWLGVMLIPTIFSGDAPHFGRMTGAMPVIAVFIGLGANWCWQRLSRFGRSRAALILTGGLFAASAVWTAYDYFGRYAHHPAMQIDFDWQDWQIGQTMAELPPDTDIYLIPTQEEMATIYFALGGERDRLRSYSQSETLVAAGRPSRPIAYIFPANDTTTAQTLQTLFPIGDTQPAPTGHQLYVVPAGALSITPLADPPTFDNKITLLAWESQFENGQLVVTLVWQATAVLPRDYTVYIHVVDQNGDLLTQQDRPPAGYPTGDWRENEIIIDRFHIPASHDDVTLRTGFYTWPELEPLGQAALLGQ